ncbi:MAG TPA: SpoIIE family protein phosphatase [Flavobacteriales bacterium]|nr:SpoIIE family protein phosphatase [Flavobacteriales bacterium]
MRSIENTRFGLKNKLLLFVLSIIASSPIKGQKFKYNYVSTEQGLPQKYIYDIAEDKSGFLLIATGEGLSRYDGKEIKTFTTSNGLVENFVTRIFVASNGDIFLGHNQGGLSVKHGQTYKPLLYSTSELGPTTCIAELSKGFIIAACQNGKVFLYNKSRVQAFNLLQDGCSIYSLTVLANGNLLFFTSEGCVLLPVKQKQFIDHNNKKIIETDGEKIQTVVRDNMLSNVFWLGTSSGKVIRTVVSSTGDLKFENIKIKSETATINEIVQAQNGTLWLATYKGVFHVRYNEIDKNLDIIQHYNEANGLPSDFVKSVYFDNEGNAWFGLYGEGLVMLRDEFFTFFQLPLPFSNDIRSIVINLNQRWLGTSNGLILVDEKSNETIEMFSPLKTNQVFEITKLCDAGQELLVGSAQNGLYIFDKNKRTWKKHELKGEKLVNQVTDIQKTPNGYWIGTRGGLLRLDYDLNLQRSWTTGEGLIHNNVNSIFTNGDEDCWVCTPGNQVSHIFGDKVTNINLETASQFLEVACMVKDETGRLWAGSNGNGLIIIDGKEIKSLKTTNGIKSDYIYSITLGNHNDIWLGHRGSLTRVNTKTLKPDVFDQQYSINNEFNPLSSCKDEKGNLWFGTTNGLLVFNHNKLKINKVPPKLNLKSVICSDKPLDLSKECVLPYGTYKIKFNFVGISFSKPEKVTYEYYLEGFDIVWSELTGNNVADYSRLEDGEYAFKVRAKNGDGYATAEKTLFRFTIRSPFWKSWWFVLVSACVFLFGTIVIVKLRERSQKRLVTLLESNLAVRTEELRNQKSLVEQKNKDITDSIHYALRIQTCILPDTDMLKVYLPDNFILYKPRDIVSGDFYWYTRKNNRLLIVCADCTGHGVPGAFMSMIGNTLFNDIIKEKDEKNPAEILYSLDNKMHELLHHDINDGMDLILLSLDLVTGELDFAGAMRPLIHVRGHEVNLLKTGRDTIGGITTQKIFVNASVQLQKGDKIYVYTDGFTDQFGGPKGRKINTNGLVSILKNFNGEPMHSQKNELTKIFEDWKGSEPQTDDVLLMGFRFENVYPAGNSN